jgi:RND family efflux transporter MFP subunit
MVPLAALAGVAVAIATVLHGNQVAPALLPIAQPPKAPFASYLAGAGIVEASTENIAVGTPVSGIVTAIYVRWGERVKAGDPLFKIDDRDLQAQLLPAIAKVKETEATLAMARTQLRLAQSVPDKRAISVEELSNRRSVVAIDEASLASAEAQVQQLKIKIERRTVRALVSGQILQIKTHLGEFAPNGVVNPALMLLGQDTPNLHVRIDVDENDAWRFRPGAPAVAFVRGNSALETPLNFVRLEPYVVPKVSLTGQTSESVDTRVLQVIYSFDQAELPVYVGQQMDVFIQAPMVASTNVHHLSRNGP